MEFDYEIAMAEYNEERWNAYQESLEDEEEEHEEEELEEE